MIKRSSNSRVWNPARTKTAISCASLLAFRLDSASISSPTHAGLGFAVPDTTRATLMGSPSFTSVQRVLPKAAFVKCEIKSGGRCREYVVWSDNCAPAGPRARQGKSSSNFGECCRPRHRAMNRSTDRHRRHSRHCDVPGRAAVATSTARRWCLDIHRPARSGTGAGYSFRTSVAASWNNSKHSNSRSPKVCGVQRLQARLVVLVEVPAPCRRLDSAFTAWHFVRHRARDLSSAE